MTFGRRCWTLLATFATAMGGASPGAAQDRPPVRFDSAHPANQTRTGTRRITHVVLHTIEGSAASARNWFKNPRARVSAHYIVDFDGSITQAVRDEDVAWHARGFNRNSIGIEHAGYAARNQWTEAQYRASAALVRWLCDRYGIPKDRDHIIGHVEVPGTRHRTDPGPHFDWDLYMRLVRGDGDDRPNAAGDSAPRVAGPAGTAHPVPRLGPRPPAPLRPGGDQLVGLLHVRWREGDAASGYPGLLLEWTRADPAPKALRVQLQEEGEGGARYESAPLSAAATSHRVAARLRHGRRYRWRLVAQDGLRRVAGPWVSFRTDFLPPRVTPRWPLDGDATVGAPVVRWRYEDDGEAQASFRVFVAEDARPERIVYDSKELNGPATAHLLPARLSPGRVYRWRVMGYDGRGNPAFTPWQRFRVEAPRVEGLSPVGTLEDAASAPVLVRWRLAAGVHGPTEGVRLQVERADGRRVVDRVWGSSAREAALSALPGGEYRWRVGVRAGGEVLWSAWISFAVPGPGQGPHAAGLSGAVGAALEDRRPSPAAR